MHTKTPKNIRVGLFGGAFDPVHIGHQQVAVSLLKKSIVDEVWFVPVYKHPWAKKLHKESLTPYEQRVAMLEACIKDSLQEHPTLAGRIKVAHFKDVSYTYDTLEFFTQSHPDTTFSWIMGSEYLSRFDDFLSLHPKLIEYPFLIYPREGFPLDSLRKNMISLDGFKQVTMSSTHIREMVRAGKRISDCVSNSVLEYIMSNTLYSQ